MTESRRLDRLPETAADTRFFDLRESGYSGPIDQDGNPDTTSHAAEILRDIAAQRGEDTAWWATPPTAPADGSTCPDVRAQAHAAAAREQQLVEALHDRGRQSGIDPELVNAAVVAARDEVRQHGQGHEQILGHRPVDPTDCCGDCYQRLMDDDTDGQ